MQSNALTENPKQKQKTRPVKKQQISNATKIIHEKKIKPPPPKSYLSGGWAPWSFPAVPERSELREMVRVSGILDWVGVD